MFHMVIIALAIVIYFLKKYINYRFFFNKDPRILSEPMQNYIIILLTKRERIYGWGKTQPRPHKHMNKWLLGNIWERVWTCVFKKFKFFLAKI